MPVLRWTLPMVLLMPRTAQAYHPDMQWYMDASYLIHFDWHTGPGHTSDGATAEHIAERLLLSRPDAIAMHSMGHPGWTTYPTDVDPSVRCPTLESDVFGAYVEGARLAGCRFQAYISTLWHDQAGKHHPEWRMRGPDGKDFHPGWLCHNSPYVEEMVLPFIREIMERYQPAGWWFDGEWLHRPCWCPWCEEKWEARYGEPYPDELTDDNRVALWTFVHETFGEYVAKVSDQIHSIDPGCMYPRAGDPRFMWPLEKYADNLTTHLPLDHGLRYAGPFARLMTNRGKPFDIMICNHTTIPGQTWVLKTAEDLIQQAAICAANGARVSQWDNPNGDASLYRYPHAVLGKALGDFLRERHPWTVPTTSVPYVAALHSWHDFYQKGSAGTCDDIYGVHDALVESHYHLDIIPEDALLERLDEYRVLVLESQTNLPDEVYAKIREFVRNGGGLVVSGEIDVDEEARPKLGEVLGTSPLSREHTALAGHSLSTAVERAACRALDAPSPHSVERGTGREVVRYGRGKVVRLEAPLFREYDRDHDPRLRALLDSCVERVVGEKLVDLDGPPCVHVSLRQKGDERIVHLCNASPGKDLHGSDLVVEHVPEVGPLTVRLTCRGKPLDVRLQPEGVEPEWEWSKGRLSVTVPRLHIHTAVVVRVPDVAAERGGVSR